MAPNICEYSSDVERAVPDHRMKFKILLTSGSVFGSRIYGELESFFALVKVGAVVLMSTWSSDILGVQSFIYIRS